MTGWNFSHFFKNFQNSHFISIFGFSTKNAFKWVPISLVLVQSFLRYPHKFLKMLKFYLPSLKLPMWKALGKVTRPITKINRISGIVELLLHLRCNIAPNYQCALLELVSFIHSVVKTIWKLLSWSNDPQGEAGTHYINLKFKVIWRVG